MKRTASTLTWQIVHECYSLNRVPLVDISRKGLDSLASILELNPDQNITFKIHNVTRQSKQLLQSFQNSKYIYTYRDIRDSFASLVRKGHWSPSSEARSKNAIEQYCKQCLVNHNYFAGKVDCLSMRYEDYYGACKQMSKDIASYLGTPLGDPEAESFAHKFDIHRQHKRLNSGNCSSEDGQASLFTTNHITTLDGGIGSYLTTLAKEEIDLIERVCSAWLIDNDYSV